MAESNCRSLKKDNWKKKQKNPNLGFSFQPYTFQLQLLSYINVNAVFFTEFSDVLK